MHLATIVRHHVATMLSCTLIGIHAGYVGTEVVYTAIMALTELERDREKRIAQNRKRLAEIGLEDMADFDLLT